MKRRCTWVPFAFVAVAHGGDPRTFFHESFDDADFAARGWYDNTDLVLSSTEHIPGSLGSVEFHFEQGATKPTSGGAIRHLFPASDTVYVSFHVKYSADWVGSGQPFHPHELYVLTTLDWEYAGPADTFLTAYVEQNEGEPLLSIQDSRNIDEAHVGEDLTEITEERAVAGCNGDSDGYGEGTCYAVAPGDHRNGKEWRAGAVLFADEPGPYDKNDWHHIEAFFRLNSIVDGIGIADGIVRYWYDGSVVFDHSDVMLRTGANPTMRFNQFLIGPWIGSGSPIAQTFWIDELTVASAAPSRCLPSGDLDGDGDVDFTDLVTLLAAWGPCSGPPTECFADFDDSGIVDFVDLLTLLAAWNP